MFLVANIEQVLGSTFLLCENFIIHQTHYKPEHRWLQVWNIRTKEQREINQVDNLDKIWTQRHKPAVAKKHHDHKQNSKSIIYIWLAKTNAIQRTCMIKQRVEVSVSHEKLPVYWSYKDLKQLNHHENRYNRHLSFGIRLQALKSQGPHNSDFSKLKDKRTKLKEKPKQLESTND